jgi:hypothetical protein
MHPGSSAATLWTSAYVVLALRAIFIVMSSSEHDNSDPGFNVAVRKDMTSACEDVDVQRPVVIYRIDTGRILGLFEEDWILSWLPPPRV